MRREVALLVQEVWQVVAATSMLMEVACVGLKAALVRGRHQCPMFAYFGEVTVLKLDACLDNNLMLAIIRKSITAGL